VPSMPKKDVGEGAVLGFEGCSWTTVAQAYCWGRDAKNRDEEGEQDDPNDEKF